MNEQDSQKLGLALIKGGNSPAEIVRCPICSGVSFVEIRHTKHRLNGRVSKGLKAEACLSCLINGEMVLI